MDLDFHMNDDALKLMGADLSSTRNARRCHSTSGGVLAGLRELRCLTRRLRSARTDRAFPGRQEAD